jgi:hypothetical protein
VAISAEQTSPRAERSGRRGDLGVGEPVFGEDLAGVLAVARRRTRRVRDAERRAGLLERADAGPAVDGEEHLDGSRLAFGLAGDLSSTARSLQNADGRVGYPEHLALLIWSTSLCKNSPQICKNIPWLGALLNDID